MAITLLVEDGTRITGANSYVNVTDAITYNTNWNNTAFTSATTLAQTTALYQAAYAMDILYGRRYISIVPPASKQGLLWPRYAILGNDFKIIAMNQVPQCVIDAQCELANMVISGMSLFPNESDNRIYKNMQVDLGDIKQNKTYWSKPTDVEHYDGFRKVELILSPVLMPEDNSKASLTL